jgi:hypothetical protein
VHARQCSKSRLFRSDSQHKRIDGLYGLFYFEFNVTSVAYLSIEVVNIFELIRLSMLVATRGESHVFR